MKVLKTIYGIMFDILSIPFVLLILIAMVGLWAVINLFLYAVRQKCYVPLNRVLSEYGFTDE